jgi:hypothetical protein
MNTLRGWCAFRSLLAILAIAVLTTSRADAVTIVGILVNPPSTAGGGATSTRSGFGTFHLYGLDQDNLGISSYNITMGPAVTASNNRSPVTSITDGNGDTFASGFNVLRTASNAPQMQGSQPLPGTSPYIVQGMGSTAGDFATIATSRGVQPGSVVGPTTSAAWGGSYNDFSNSGSRKWLFLGEGTWNTSLPFTGASMFVPAAVLTAFRDANNGSIATTTQVFLGLSPPEPSSKLLLCFGIVGGFGVIRRRRA